MKNNGYENQSIDYQVRRIINILGLDFRMVWRFISYREGCY